MEQIRRQLEFFANLGVTRFNISPAPDLASGDPLLALEEIRSDLGDCQRCKLCSHRTNIVFGVGAESADLMFVGEAPGRDEDLQGVPFVGRAGQLLTRIIQAMQHYDQVF